MKYFFGTFLIAMTALMCTHLSFMPSAQAVKLFGKKNQASPEPKASVQNADDEDDEKDEDYIERENVDLSQFKSKELLIEGAVCDACVYKIKSVLQQNPAVFKVNHVGLKNFYLYFNKGQTLSDNEISEMIATIGYKVIAIKAGSSAQQKSSASMASKKDKTQTKQ